MPACSIDAVVSNLPFGHAHTLPGDPGVWYAKALREIARVVRPGGSAVLLMPDGPPVRRAIERCDTLKPDFSRPVELLGQRTNLWRFTRV
jgi:SAM-dependent methyltransferase